MSKQKYGLVSVSQLAKIKKVTPQAVSKAIKEKRLKAMRIGHQWVIEENEYKKWRKWQ